MIIIARARALKDETKGKEEEEKKKKVFLSVYDADLFVCKQAILRRIMKPVRT